MAKHTTPKQSHPTSTNALYERSVRFHNEAVQVEDDSGDQKEIDRLFDAAGYGFWMAFVLGHPKAAYCLSGCFKEGLGAKQDDYIATLLFGVALGLGDTRCQSEIDSMLIPDSMKGAVKDIVELVHKVQKEVDLDVEFSTLALKLAEQLKLFDKSIKLPHLSAGQEISDLFLQHANKVVDQAPIHEHIQAQDIPYIPDHQHDNSHQGDINLAGHDSKICCDLF